MNISLFPNIKDNKPIKYTGNLQTISKGLLHPCLPYEVAAKKEIPLWSPTVFQGTRSSANAREIGFLVYDIDDGLTPFSTWRLFSKWIVLAHTSFSHKPHFHKYRIILPLAKPVPAAEWDRAAKWAVNFWADIVGRGEPDMKALKDRARIYFRYALPLDEEHTKESPQHPKNYFSTASSLSGDLLTLDWESIPKEAPKAPRTKIPSKGKFKHKAPVTIESLQLDPRFRTSIAERAGGKIVGNTARYIQCPQCQDNSVFFSIDLSMPNVMKYPQCNHKNSCQWWGTLKDLL